jgi:hypothetical protein
LLYEEQAAELLRRCEALVGRTLHQVRGNLRKSSSRAEAVWELLVLEAVSQLGKVDHESATGGPDIRLQMPSGRWVSIEVTYLHPRFEEEERRCRLVTRWMAEVERRIGPSRVALECSFDGGRATPSGTRLTLPSEHERKQFMGKPELASFVAAVRQRPKELHRVAVSGYDVVVTSRPRVSEKDRSTTSSRPALDAPKVPKEHGAFRALRAKLAQHNVDEPHVVCIGSDVSRVLARREVGNGVTLEQALSAAVRKSGRLSAVVVVSIESQMPILSGVVRHAHTTIFPVAECRHPLAPDDLRHLTTLDLNRWKYSFSLPRRELPPQHRHPKVSGPMSIGSAGQGAMKLTIPASLLVDVLAGRKTLLEDYGGEEGLFSAKVRTYIREGWTIVGCTFLAGNIEQARSAMVELELAPPHLAVFWDRDRDAL